MTSAFVSGLKKEYCCCFVYNVVEIVMHYALDRSSFLKELVTQTQRSSELMMIVAHFE